MTRKPEYLKLLWIEDSQMPNSLNLVKSVPVGIQQVSEWLAFLKMLKHGRMPEMQLLTIDFCFDDDRTTPPFGGQPEDYRDDLDLDQLSWSPHLDTCNTGILIGATAITIGAFKDIPVGAAIYTGRPDLVAKDMATTMLITQILAGCNSDLNIERTREALRGTIQSVFDGPGDCLTALPLAVQRFREVLARRVAAPGAGPGLHFGQDSISYLLNVFNTVGNEEELDRALNERGLEMTDRHGKEYAFHLRSLFLDVLLEWEPSKRPGRRVLDVSERLPLVSVRPGGLIHNFISQLSQEASIAEVDEYLDYDDKPSMNLAKRFPNQIRTRLVTLLCAWIKCYMEKCKLCLNESWDPLKDAPDEQDLGYDSLPNQLTTLLRILKPLRETPLPMKSKGGRSIVKAVSRACANTPEHSLYRPLRFHETNSSAKRARGIVNLMAHLEHSHCLDVNRLESGQTTYRFAQGNPRMHPEVSQKELARSLGYEADNPHNNIYRVFIANGIFNPGQFIKKMGHQRWPEHLLEPCQQFARNNYEEVDILSYLPEWLHPSEEDT